MSLPGVDLASFQGAPGSWREKAGAFSWAAVKATELQPDGTRYTDPDLAADWEFLRANGKGRICYLFGHPATSPAETVDLFATTVRGIGLEPADAIALDLEVTDGRNPAQVSVWARVVLRSLQGLFGRRPLLYTFRDFPAGGNCAGLAPWPLWISDPDHQAGRPQVPQPWTAWAIHQYSVTGDLDRDLALYPSLAAMAADLGARTVPLPPPPPREARKDREMILVEVDRASVPAGTEWPGVFLLVSDGSLRHVTAEQGSVSNVKSYQAAGIPGPVAITWGEYLARKGA